ncbi:MAG: DUF1599 domain-containing protein [Cytophagales bacterium]|nr:hypothetical protein [Marinoscillum sp.]MAS38861.1 hypothetical protein [Flammeovirgaceae bacterium]OUX26092.1 MAG: hypothetical protein CBE22_04055 [Flammeovirgaceae bacterium TMED262]PDH43471.1 MAG: hypothetical protein CNE34_05640 [Rhodothermaeota bacterium MED-G18]
MKTSTRENYKKIIEICKDIYLKKSEDYGSAWRILRVTSLTDQIFIKAQRIRSIQEKNKMKVNENIEDEFIGIINYCIIAIIQLEYKGKDIEIDIRELESLYDKYSNEIMDLLENKNHDYDEAWKEMRVSSMTDIILMKLYRTKQIESNKGKTLISEGVKANYQDIVNYSVFCLIKLLIFKK